MNRILALILALALCFTFVGCSNDETNTENQEGQVLEGVITPLKSTDATAQSTYTLDCMSNMGIYQTPESKYNTEADKLYQEIEAVADTLKPSSTGKGIYVSNDGNDSNSGTKDKPFSTIAKAVEVSKAGDVIYLNRGDLWRENITCKEGVSIGAYGEGNKPTIYGSPRNYAEEKWQKSDIENVYTTSSAEAYNIGAIIFNHGQAVGSAKTSLTSLRENFDFYEDFGKRVIYVYMEQGNPADVCQSIEFSNGRHIISLESNSKVQNLRLMYGGAHGISMQSVDNVSFEGLIIGYIGGSYQDFDSKLRYGNGIEIWGTCDNYKIDRCFVFQCYDAGITMQYSSEEDKPLYEKNIVFSNNLLDYNYYAIEYFFHCRVNPKSAVKNVKIDNNVVRFSGYCFGEHTRKDKGAAAAIKGNSFSMRTENFLISNNIFEMSYTEHRRYIPSLITTSGIEVTDIPTFKNNIYAQTEGYYFITYQGDKLDAENTLSRLGDSSGKVITY